jgi:hypothetical protein
MSPVFFCGMPIAVVGPVADTMSPIFTWAAAALDTTSAMSSMAMRIGTTGSGVLAANR